MIYCTVESTNEYISLRCIVLQLITMIADLWRSLTARFMALGHPLREAECMAAGILAGCLVILMIMGYRFGDAERERLPVVRFPPANRTTGTSVHCGNVPGSVDWDGMLLPCRPRPVLPAGCRDRNGYPGGLRGPSAPAGSPAPVCW